MQLHLLARRCHLIKAAMPYGAHACNSASGRGLASAGNMMADGVCAGFVENAMRSQVHSKHQGCNMHPEALAQGAVPQSLAAASSSHGPPDLLAGPCCPPASAKPAGRPKNPISVARLAHKTKTAAAQIGHAHTALLAVNPPAAGFPALEACLRSGADF